MDKLKNCGNCIYDRNHCYEKIGLCHDYIKWESAIKEPDNINNPHHYTQGGIQPIDYIIKNNLDFLEGNVVKYVTRYKYKNGLEDLKKAKFYLEKLIKREEK